MEFNGIIRGTQALSDIDMFYDAPEIRFYDESESEEDFPLSDGYEGNGLSLVDAQSKEETEAGGVALNTSDDSDVVMVDHEIVTNEVGAEDGQLETKILKPRNYQLEMLEESLRRNIIVAMDTGSGKTHIAVLRIAAELERAPPEKLVWFMAPTVALCEQQYHVLQEQLPSVQIKFFSSADNVDRWTTKALWDAVLHNVKVVVSTYQILLDTLTHAFVSLDSIALLVFDEAHNCVKSNPGSQIMRDFYMPKRIKSDSSVPHILGLSASPIMNSSISSLDRIEETLDAICRTPSKHRAELLQQVKLPALRRIFFTPKADPRELKTATATLASLHKIYRELDVREDPYVLKLKAEDTEKSRRNIEKAFQNRGTYCQDQFKSLCLTSTFICHELGECAADFYVQNAISRFTKLAKSAADYLDGIQVEERLYLAAALAKVHGVLPDPRNSPLSDKLNQFIKTLLEVYHPGISAIVFVRQRATVAVLAYLLSTHEEIRKLFNIGTFVGLSQDPRRITNITEILETQNQWKALEDFRSGAINLIVATSALEEGIDVPACNTVLCFNDPDNLKVLVQRRGRARSRESDLILMVPEDETDRVDKWLEFEQYMKQVYANDMRELKKIEDLENLHEPGHREFRVESTGALLNLNNAVQHLYHFCATLPPAEYVDLRPDFICTPANLSYVNAKVILPPNVDEKYRYAQSQQAWPSEKDAIRDVAFEACLMLFHGGQIDEHLLPLFRHDTVSPVFDNKIEQRSCHVKASAQFNPWALIAELWSKPQDSLHMFDVKVESESKTVSLVQMILPDCLEDFLPITVYWDALSTLRVTISPVLSRTSTIGTEGIERGRAETSALLSAAYGHRRKFDGVDFTAVFTMASPETSALLRIPAHKPASELRFPSGRLGGHLIIRDCFTNNRPFLYQEWLANRPPDTSIRNLHWKNDVFTEGVPYLALKPISKRADFLHPVPSQNEVSTSDKPFHYALPSSICVVDKLPFSLLQFALLMPSILHRIQVHMVAEKLAATVLLEVGFSGLRHLVTAISAPSAREEANYQRLEFLGDSVLKLCTTVQLLKENPDWHEGYLSGQKDRFVCNARLCRAAIESGLDQFILTKPFTGQNWSPTYISDFLKESQESPREMSSKMLADVVEAVLGAAMVDGGIDKVLKCLQVFITDTGFSWTSFSVNRQMIFNKAPSDEDLPVPLQPLEKLIGYAFQKKSLLVESMTHVSCATARSSFERLEFLGDSILDSIIVDKVFNHRKQLPLYTMHLARTALVNADFLAFMCMELAMDQEKMDITTNPKAPKPKLVKSTFSLPLWKFMRHTSPPISKAQQAMQERYLLARDSIIQAFKTSDHYPWIPLARLQAPKFFSDIVESLLGALWVDSGSFEACEGLLERMGILPYLRRIVDDDVHLIHPKEELGIVAVSEKVKYVTGVEDGEGFCEVLVGGRVVGRSRGEKDLELLKGAAAEEAVRFLKAEKEKLGVDGGA